MDRNRMIGRLYGAVPRAFVVAAVMFMLPAAASAQEVNEDYIVNHLGPAAEEMQAAGLDGSAESSPFIIEIAQRWLIEPAYWVSVDEAWMLVRADRDDAEARSRLAALTNPLQKYPSRVVVARFGVLMVGLTCQQAQEKARTAQRLADALTRVSQLNGVGTGLVGAISQGAARFVAPMAVATMVTGFAATWAGQLAAGYRNAPCVTGGQPWRFRPSVLSASFSLDPSRIPHSSRGRRGLAYAASRTGPTFRPLEVGHRSLSRLGSGRWRSSSSRLS